jgi:hypothetical protein
MAVLSPYEENSNNQIPCLPAGRLQINSNIQLLNDQTMFGYWNLDIDYYLLIGAWLLGFKIILPQVLRPLKRSGNQSLLSSGSLHLRQELLEIHTSQTLPQSHSGLHPV